MRRIACFHTSSHRHLARFRIEIGRMDSCAGNIFMIDKNKMEHMREVRAVC